MKKRALCIGINEYPGTGSDLSGCVNDARDWASELQASGFDVELLLDAQATKQGILDRMRKLASLSKNGDSVVVTFSGHGSFVPDLDGDEEDGLDECWCPYDVQKHQIIDDELHEVISSKRKGVRWVLISDSCHSGTVARFSTMAESRDAGEGQSPQPRVRFLPPSMFCHGSRERRRLDDLGSRRYGGSPPGRSMGLLMAGCQDNEYSFDAWFDGRANGAFTHAALSTLRGLRAAATYAEWYQAIAMRLPSQQHPQTPNLDGSEKAKAWSVFGGGRSDGASNGPAAEESGANEPASVGKQLAAQLLQQRSARSRGRHARGRESIPLVAIGDSWLDYPRDDVRDVLEDDYGYDIDSVADAGARVEDIAYRSEGQLRKLLRTIDKMVDRGRPPRAVLLSGGGNDIAGEEFAPLLHHVRSPHRGLDINATQAALNRIQDAYVTIITAISTLIEDRLGQPIPILTHGYDYAVPDGRGFMGGWWRLPGPWLRPGFEQKGYSDETEMQSIIKQLIDSFHGMQVKLLQRPDCAHVAHVDLRGELPNGENYKRWWANELHPTQRGFDMVARSFANALERALD